MYLGELFDSLSAVERNINVYKEASANIEIRADNVPTLLVDVFEDISEQANRKSHLAKLLDGLKVDVDGDPTDLNSMIYLREATEKKISIIDLLITKNSYNVNLSDLIKTKQTLIKSFNYLNSIINRFIWGHEIDN